MHVLRKKEFSSFDIAAAIQELKGLIADSRVNNIYQLDEKTVIFKLHKTDLPPIRLVVEAGRRLHATSYAEENPSEPPAFCMALRKYLRGAWVAGIDQYEFERIVTVSFRTKTGLLKLVVELFGEGNIILTNEQNVIIHALAFKKMRDRDILHNVVLQLPPSRGKNPFKVTQGELEESLKNAGETEVVRSIASFLGVGGVYAEEILLRTNVEKTKQCNTLTKDEVEGVFGALQELLSSISSMHLEPCIVLGEDGDFLDVVPLKLKRYEGFKTQVYDSFNRALDEFYLRVTVAERAVDRVEVDKLKKEAERLRRVVADQEKSIHEDEAKANRDKLIGDTIYAHYSELQTVLDQLLKANQQGKDWNTIITGALAAKKTGKIPEASLKDLTAKILH